MVLFLSPFSKRPPSSVFHLLLMNEKLIFSPLTGNKFLLICLTVTIHFEFTLLVLNVSSILFHSPLINESFFQILFQVILSFKKE